MGRIDEIKKRCEAATPGPWSDIWDAGAREWTIRRGPHQTPHWLVMSHVRKRDTEDFAFIAHAREDIPWLVAEVERLRTIERLAREYVDTTERCAELLRENLGSDLVPAEHDAEWGEPYKALREALKRGEE